MFKVFYSWISDREKKTNRVFISRAIRLALEELDTETLSAGLKSRNQKQQNFEIIECGNKNKTGDILAFITKELPRCHAHVVDLTLINNPKKIKDSEGNIKITRATPNPNNMFELGISFNCLGVNKVVPVFNKVFGNVSDLPFDVRGLNVIEYSHEDKNALKESLKPRLLNLQQEILTQKIKMIQEYKRYLQIFMSFFEDFIRTTFDCEKLINDSIKTLGRDTTNEPNRQLAEWLMNDLSNNHLRSNQDERWGDRFLIYLRCLSADCRRLTTKYPDQESLQIYKNIKGLGFDADSLELILGRVLGTHPKMLSEKFIMDKVFNFLIEFKQAQIELD